MMTMTSHSCLRFRSAAASSDSIYCLLLDLVVISKNVLLLSTKQYALALALASIAMLIDAFSCEGPAQGPLHIHFKHLVVSHGGSLFRLWHVRRHFPPQQTPIDRLEEWMRLDLLRTGGVPETVHRFAL